jgi:hypothetical protein
MHMSFEEFLVRVEQIPSPMEESAREVLWLVPKVLGVGADKRGAREIFISGPQLKARSSTVQRRLEHQSWQGRDSTPFEANRVVLPLAEHFSAVAALIVFEFARALGAAGASRDIQGAFAEIEPLIEMALRRSHLSEENVVGLLGELILLEQMLRSLPPQSDLRASVLDMWRGHKQASRDFCLGAAGIGIEVKTTGAGSSTHHIHGIAQIEPALDSDVPEQELYLLSVGMAHAETGAFSVPSCASRVLELLGSANSMSRTSLQLRFLSDLRAYGGELAAGYDHDTMQEFPAYAVRFTMTFEPRLYDVCDPEFKVVGRAALRDTFVAPEGIAYKVDLPSRINQFNPAVHWREKIASLVNAALGVL